MVFLISYVLAWERLFIHSFNIEDFDETRLGVYLNKIIWNSTSYIFIH